MKLKLLAALGLVFSVSILQAADPLVWTKAETAGLDGREWNKSFTNAFTADAVHRSVLLRFPGAAGAVAERLAAGGAVEKAEVVFTYGAFETNASGYDIRTLLRDALAKDPPNWHLVAWPLRRPWSGAADASRPTFNAWLDGAGYWAKYGAQDEKADRYPVRLGPVELSVRRPEGRLDVTALLTDAAYGPGPGERLRAFEEQGLLLRKWETYDVKYADWSAYEWAVPSGGNGLTFRDPRLEVTFKAGGGKPAALPPARDLKALADRLVAEKSGGAPTAVMPDEAAIKALAERLAFRKPDWMPDWQWARVQELRTIGGGSEYADAIESGDPARFQRQIRNILMQPPRFWLGWGVQDQLLLWHQYNEALPDYAKDHVLNYWRAWLFPDLPNEALTIDPQGDAKFKWYEETEDWRGLFSFFRLRWTHGVGTMNFNHTACMGALLGGRLIGSDFAETDGREGMEKMLLRFWTFQDGTSQEMLDHYYFSITLSAQKMFADYAPEPIDRLMGEIIRDRAVELLVAGYQPRLRRILGASGRTRMSNVLGFEQEGGYSVLHTLSPKGVLFHPDAKLDAKQRGMHLFGYDFPPGRVALQTRASPWMPEWSANMIDGKPLPFEETSSETTRGTFRNPPLWRRVYLGQSYGLASQDIKGGSVDVIGQWNPGAEPAADAEQLGSLTVRYNINEPRLAQTGGGMMPYSGGTVTFQHKNAAIVCTKPRTENDRTWALAGSNGVTKLYSTVALWNFREPAGWSLYADGKELKEFPAKLKAGQRLTLKDGNVYVAILPLPATDLGRDAEVVVEPGVPELLGDRYKEAGTKLAPALMINSYNLKQASAVPTNSPAWEKISREAYGGFVIEMGDAAEHGSFEAFQKKVRDAVMETRWDAAARVLHVVYHSGSRDVMEMGFCTDYAQSEVHFAVEPGQHTKAIPYRRVNGKDPYLPAGIDRDTTLAQQGTTGRLEKNGAVLELEPGRTGYLMTEPVSGTVIGYNPLPDLSAWKLAVPGGAEVRADGKLGLARVAVCAGKGTVRIDQAWKEGQSKEAGTARRLLLTGFKAAPAVTLNGKKAEALPVEVEGKPAFAVALGL